MNNLIITGEEKEEKCMLGKIMDLQSLRESCGVYNKGNTIKFRRYAKLEVSPVSIIPVGESWDR